MARKPLSSPYIDQQRRDYSLYVMQQRAIPAVTDGLKAGGRRALWTARDGKKYKSASLAGATMPLHPHGAPEGAIDTLAAPYGNNIPLFKGDGAFGTLLNPTAYGASRYTSVSTSVFADDVLFKDIEIVPMTENYDGTLLEPVHFLPLVPLALLNPSDGIAVGYATSILPRSLDDLIIGQVTHLMGKKNITNPNPTFHPIHASAIGSEPAGKGIAYYFIGEIERQNTMTIRITRLPYGQSHDAVISKLDALEASGTVTEYTDRSKDVINIEVKFKRGYLSAVSEEVLFKQLGLSHREIENLNVVDFGGKAVWSTTAVDIIRAFTDWRLKWYVVRYERLRDLLKNDIQRYYDIRSAIKNKVSAIAAKTDSRAELKDVLTTLKIVHIDYIADLPVYRFTEEERVKNEKRIEEAEAQMKVYLDLLASEDKRKKVYIAELQEVLNKYNKGVYA